MHRLPCGERLRQLTHEDQKGRSLARPGSRGYHSLPTNKKKRQEVKLSLLMDAVPMFLRFTPAFPYSPSYSLSCKETPVKVARATADELLVDPCTFVSFRLDRLGRILALRHDRHIEPAVGALQHKLLMSSCTQEIRDRPDENKPTHNHKNIRQPLAGSDLSAPASRAVAGHIIWVKVDVVRILWCIAETRSSVWRTSNNLARAGTFHRKTVLNKSDAETCAGAVLGGVRSVEEISKQETDQLKGHRNDSVPNKGKYGANGQAIHEYFVSVEAGCKNCSFPVGRSSVCRSLLIRL